MRSCTSSPLTRVPLVLSRSVSTSLPLVFLDFDVEAADPLVVELNGVAFFAADRHRRGQLFEHAAPVRPIQNSQRHVSHR